MTPSDVAFELFVATVAYDDLSPYEQRLWRHAVQHPGRSYDLALENQIAAYSRNKRKGS